MINYIYKIPSINRQVKNDSCKSAKYGGWYCENSDTASIYRLACLNPMLILQHFSGRRKSVAKQRYRDCR